MSKEYKLEKVLINQIRCKKGEEKPTSGMYPPITEVFEDLKRSLIRTGMLLPVFVDSQKTIISGHYRYWAAKELKMKDVPIVVVDNNEDILKYLE